MSERLNKPIIFSGMRPTGKLQLGNLFGALDKWIELQDSYHCFFCVVDWHALTTAYEEPGEIRSNIKEMVLDWLSCGIDPEKAVIFRQSDVKQHAELHLLLSMLTPLSWLERCPTYKEQLQQIQTRNLATYGFLGYPMLMAADILLYKAEAVPVGEDQIPHIELTREVARRFNFLYNVKLFPEPQTILNRYKIVPGLDGRKMSKSYNNTIDIATPPGELMDKVRMMVTDPGRIRKDDPGNPEVCTVYSFHNIFSSEILAELEEECRQGKQGCVDCKKRLAKSMAAFLEPIYERRLKLEKYTSLIEDILAAGREKAESVAEVTMAEAREAMGL
ncbi:MAG: tryptophan--tRNA ligase [Firmicutes bacterium]|nr:tryptophan--tRNA ligase [Bacillota bacterium]